MSSNINNNKKQHPFLFAAVLCIICSFLLTFAATSLKPFQEKNKAADKQKNVLKVLGILKKDQKYTASDISSLYTKNIQNAWINNKGQLLRKYQKDAKPLFLSVKNNKLKAYAVPITGQGLWSTLYGYFAIKNDGQTVIGITFYEHGETPGLGAEIEKEWFQNNFKGKKIINNNNQYVCVEIIKGKVADKIPARDAKNYVDGISGATITGNGINSFLKANLAEYEPFAARLRKGKNVL